MEFNFEEIDYAAMETTTELANANGESNNMTCVEQIAKQFGFKKAY
jgi:hypothetical protein